MADIFFCAPHHDFILFITKALSSNFVQRNKIVKYGSYPIEKNRKYLNNYVTTTQNDVIY